MLKWLYNYQTYCEGQKVGLLSFFKTKSSSKRGNSEQERFGAAFAENRKFMLQSTLSLEDAQSCFDETDIASLHNLGDIHFPTGRVVVADPLAYLYSPDMANALDFAIPPGNYPVWICSRDLGFGGQRIASAKLRITDKQAVRYRIASPEGKPHSENSPAAYPVDAGVASICDKSTADRYKAFIENWHIINPSSNHYDDYFAEYFAESYEKYPHLQRRGGDFITWSIPGSKHNIAMFSSGFGDGFYQCYWGSDENGEVCELLLPLINTRLFVT